MIERDLIICKLDLLKDYRGGFDKLAEELEYKEKSRTLKRILKEGVTSKDTNFLKKLDRLNTLYKINFSSTDLMNPKISISDIHRKLGRYDSLLESFRKKEYFLIVPSLTEEIDTYAIYKTYIEKDEIVASNIYPIIKKKFLVSEENIVGNDHFFFTMKSDTETIQCSFLINDYSKELTEHHFGFAIGKHKGGDLISKPIYLSDCYPDKELIHKLLTYKLRSEKISTIAKDGIFFRNKELSFKTVLGKLTDSFKQSKKSLKRLIKRYENYPLSKEKEVVFFKIALKEFSNVVYLHDRASKHSEFFTKDNCQIFVEFLSTHYLNNEIYIYIKAPSHSFYSFYYNNDHENKIIEAVNNYKKTRGSIKFILALDEEYDDSVRVKEFISLLNNMKVTYEIKVFKSTSKVSYEFLIYSTKDKTIAYQYSGIDDRTYITCDGHKKLSHIDMVEKDYNILKHKKYI